MAGAGYKLFNTGDVLTAAQVNTYLQEQVVMVFANAAARTTALSGVLAEGMVSYLKDTDALEIYSGAAWVGYGSGDITGVTAGTGISGGGTSGTVTITNSMATEITAAGDIIVGTGSGTFDNLPIGTTGQVLTADTSVSPYKIKWASASSSPTFVGWSVRRDTNVNITNDTATQVSFNDETLDSHSFHSTTVNPSRVTIPSNYAGKYLVFFNAGWAANSTGYRQSLLYKNGAGWGNLQTGPANATVSNYILGEMIIDLAVGDYLEVYVRQNSGGTLALNDNSYFNGIWLGA